MTKLRYVLRMIAVSVQEFSELRGYDEHATNVFRVRTEGILWFAARELNDLRVVITTKHDAHIVWALQAVDAWEKKNGRGDSIGAPLVNSVRTAVHRHYHQLE